MKIAIDTQTILGQKTGFGFYNFSLEKFPRNHSNKIG